MWHDITIVGQHTQSDDITALGQHARSDDVGRGMTSPPLDNTHGRQHRAWHDITTFGQHTRSAMSGMAFHHRPWKALTVGNVGSGMKSTPLDRTHGRQRRAWHDITALGLHTQSAMSGMAKHQRPWRAHTVSIVGRCMISPPLDSTHGHTTSGKACNHRLWAAHTVERRQAWHAIIALGRQTRSNDVRRDMQ